MVAVIAVIAVVAVAAVVAMVAMTAVVAVVAVMVMPVATAFPISITIRQRPGSCVFSSSLTPHLVQRAMSPASRANFTAHPFILLSFTILIGHCDPKGD